MGIQSRVLQWGNAKMVVVVVVDNTNGVVGMCVTSQMDVSDRVEVEALEQRSGEQPCMRPTELRASHTRESRWQEGLQDYRKALQPRAGDASQQSRPERKMRHNCRIGGRELKRELERENRCALPGHPLCFLREHVLARDEAHPALALCLFLVGRLAHVDGVASPCVLHGALVVLGCVVVDAVVRVVLRRVVAVIPRGCGLVSKVADEERCVVH